MTSNHNKPSFLQKLAAGGIAGIIGTTAIFPVDLVKTRLQNFNKSQNISALKMTKSILRAEGFRGLYRGLLANLVGVTPEKAIKLAANDYFRSVFAQGKPQENLPIHLGMLSGGLAGLAQVIATNPMETVKIRMQVANAGGTVIRKPSTIDVVKELGIRGMYRGSPATLSRDIPFSMIFFQLSSSLKELFRSTETKTVDFKHVFASSLIAGAVSAYIVTPMDVVKTRIQSGSMNVGLLEAYKLIWKIEGISAFFRGSLQRCFIVAPLFGISLTVYEFQQRLMTSK